MVPDMVAGCSLDTEVPGLAIGRSHWMPICLRLFWSGWLEALGNLVRYCIVKAVVAMVNNNQLKGLALTTFLKWSWHPQMVDLWQPRVSSKWASNHLLINISLWRSIGIREWEVETAIAELVHHLGGSDRLVEVAADEISLSHVPQVNYWYCQD